VFFLIHTVSSSRLRDPFIVPAQQRKFTEQPVIKFPLHAGLSQQFEGVASCHCGHPAIQGHQIYR
jgi:hypothetical protein